MSVSVFASVMISEELVEHRPSAGVPILLFYPVFAPALIIETSNSDWNPTNESSRSF